MMQNRPPAAEGLNAGNSVNPDMCNKNFCLNRTDWKLLVPSYTYNSYTHNPEFA